MSSDPAREIASRYGLLRENFILDPLRDVECFAREDVDTGRIARDLDTDLITGLAPKRLVFGPYGGGKTHTLMRTMQELGKQAPIRSFRMECPDLSRRSRFHDLYREGIMREFGQDFVLGLFEEAVQQVSGARRPEILERLTELLGDEEIAKGVIRLIDPHFDALRLWRWISGVSLARADLDDLGQTQDLAQTEAARLAGIVCLIGRLLREQEGKRLVLVLDEMERLESIGPEQIPTFVTGFTRLMDPNQTDVTILMGASAGLESELVDIFQTRGPVISRLTSDSIIEIPALQEPDVDLFIRGVIQFVRDPGCNIEELVQQARQSTNEKLNPDVFPFSEEAIEALKSRLMTQMLPREIAMRMTRALGRAYRENRAAVTQEVFS